MKEPTNDEQEELSVNELSWLYVNAPAGSDEEWDYLERFIAAIPQQEIDEWCNPDAR